MNLLRLKHLSPGSVPALFLHIQKTAGTTLVNHARQFYGASIASHGDYWGKDPKQLRDIAFVSGHMGYQYARQLMSGRFTFTFLRNPGERIISMYYFCKSRDPREFEIFRKAHEMSFTEFLKAALSDPCVRMHIWNNQVWQLAHGYTHLDDRTVYDFNETELLLLSKEHLAQFSYVGFTETFDTDSIAILKALRLPRPRPLPKQNISPERPKMETLPSDIRETLDELTHLDRRLYDYAKKEFSGTRVKRGGLW